MFAQDGTYNVLITVTDNGGDVGTTSVSVTVANLAPVASALTPTTIDEGTTFVSTGTFTDPGTEDTFTGTVNYGDGTPVAPLTLWRLAPSTSAIPMPTTGSSPSPCVSPTKPTPPGVPRPT